MSSPRMILQTSGTTVIFQWRFNSGSLTLSYNPSGPPTPQTWDMKGWKIAYRLALGQSDVDSSSALYNQLRAKINQPGNYSITSIQLLPPAATSSFWASPEQGFSSYGNSGFENASFPYYNMFGGLLGQKIVEAGSNGLLLGGYVAKKSGDTTGIPFTLPSRFQNTHILQPYCLSFGENLCTLILAHEEYRDFLTAHLLADRSFASELSLYDTKCPADCRFDWQLAIELSLLPRNDRR